MPNLYNNMNPFIRTLYERRQYLIAFTFFLLVTFLYWSCYSKVDCFILLNGRHTTWLESFFTWFTLLGDGMLVAGVCVLLLTLGRYLQVVHLSAAYIVSGLLAQLIKHATHMPRPRVLLQPEHYNQFIEGVTGGGWSSFPSGHTTTAFAVATVLAFYTSNKWLQLTYLALAVAVGYSRIYLGQHFLEDVQAGSIIGVFVAACVYAWIPAFRFFGRRIAGGDRISPVAVQ